MRMGAVAHMQTKNQVSGLGPIFVVDDEPIIGELLCQVLQRAGFRVIWFSHPSLALAAIARANPPPALLITDYLMPSLTGIELIERAKRLQPALKTILCSGRLQESDLASFSVRPDRFCRKPVMPKVLIEILHTTLAAAVLPPSPPPALREAPVGSAH